MFGTFQKICTKNGFITFLLIILVFAIIFNQKQAVYAKDIKDDGLLLIDTFEKADIKMERLMLNYTGVVDTFKNTSNVEEVKNEIEQAFSINLSLTSAPDNKDLIKYLGQKTISALPNATIQVTLANVLHENGAYQAHLILSLSSNLTDKTDFVNAYSYLEKSLETISVDSKIKVNIQGTANQKLSHDQQQKVIMDMLSDINASVREGLNEKDVISLTGYSEKINYSLKSNNKPINVQMASRYDSLSGNTVFTIGTPLITMEY
ncbi:YwmB family TATA-box binding protein [Aquibacillus salsiterrae]|uniref:YwmB family TATA-box binding protein n=1 Tax=Aquibacillus salsiterrae TaxID=2950439 RepID=A0A9X3WD05_9BACI|nr:YwmB family TATA-box binding protein [Aquibacillus salsiterrae]MDC3417587.1 YwmB family TATA-box binding protein [Aquibacillus salsiterrae]